MIEGLTESQIYLLAAFAAGLVLAALVALMVGLNRGRGREAVARLEGQLSQLAVDNGDLRRSLDERLAAMGSRIGDSLTQHSERTHQSLTGLMERLAVIDRAQANIKELSGHVVGLQDVLSNKQARGAFGETQLANIIADVLPTGTYALQATLSNGNRVDCLIKLPNPPGAIAIDAKFPLEGFRALMAAEGEPARLVAARAFQTAVRKHVSDIAEKYILPGETGDWALLFLPSERIHAELHATFGTVIEEAQRRRVAIVSPATMMAVVQTVRAIFLDVRMREQAALIQRHVAEMADDVRRLDERAEALQKHFGQATRDLDLIRTSTGKIVGRTEKIAGVDLTETSELTAAETAKPLAGRSGAS
jgi:DNA recombination protein RmuC